LADAIVDASVKTVEANGQRISCQKGCGACCRQLVPIAEVEARHLRDVVQELPEPRRSVVLTRFAEAYRRLEAEGLLNKLLRPDQLGEDDVKSLGLKYFFLGIPCPFLEEESCSIYADRPAVCREYLVTSPAANCVHPSPQTVERVPVAFQVWKALARLDDLPAGSKYLRWVPLIMSLEWADAHPAEPPPRPGPEMLRDLLNYLGGTKTAGATVPPPPLAQIPP